MKKWTKKQHEMYNKYLLEQTEPLCGDKECMGYLHSREFLAAVRADGYYHWQRMIKSIEKEIKELEKEERKNKKKT